MIFFRIFEPSIIPMISTNHVLSLNKLKTSRKRFKSDIKKSNFKQEKQKN